MLTPNPDQFEAGAWQSQFSFATARPVCDPKTLDFLQEVNEVVIKYKTIVEG